MTLCQISLIEPIPAYFLVVAVFCVLVMIVTSNIVSVVAETAPGPMARAGPVARVYGDFSTCMMSGSVQLWFAILSVPSPSA